MKGRRGEVKIECYWDVFVSSEARGEKRKRWKVLEQNVGGNWGGRQRGPHSGGRREGLHEGLGSLKQWGEPITSAGFYFYSDVYGWVIWYESKHGGFARLPDRNRVHTQAHRHPFLSPGEKAPTLLVWLWPGLLSKSLSYLCLSFRVLPTWVELFSKTLIAWFDSQELTG